MTVAKVQHSIETVKVTGKKKPIKVICTADKEMSEREQILTSSDKEMDARAKQAVSSAVAKNQFCKKPIARYDVVTKEVYVEYPNGEKKYVK